MNYEDLEQAIKTRLTTKIPSGIDIVVLPETQAENNRPFEKTRAVIYYGGSVYGAGKNGSLSTIEMGSSIQEETIHIMVEIESRKLRGENGLYSALTKIRQALLGFEPLQLDKLKAIEAKLNKFEENLWSYTLTMGTMTLAIEDTETLTEPTLNSVDFNDNFQ